MLSLGSSITLSIVPKSTVSTTESNSHDNDEEVRIEMDYEVEIVKEKGGKGTKLRHRPLALIQSPKNTRIFEYGPLSHAVSPYTAYINKGTEEVTLSSIIPSFQFTDNTINELKIDIYIDNSVVYSHCISHESILQDSLYNNGNSGDSIDLIPINIPMEITIQPNSIIKVIATVATTEFTVGDISFILLTDDSNNSMQPYGETSLFKDLKMENSEEHNEKVLTTEVVTTSCWSEERNYGLDIDASGWIWQTDSSGKNKRTKKQFSLLQLPEEILSKLSTATLRIIEPTISEEEKEDSSRSFCNDAALEILLMKQKSLFCLQLKKSVDGMLTIHYCDESKVSHYAQDCPYPQCLLAPKQDIKMRKSYVLADFDGDLWPDRLRVQTDSSGVSNVWFSRGGPFGLLRDRIWFRSTCCIDSGVVRPFKDYGDVQAVYDAHRMRWVAVIDWGCRAPEVVELDSQKSHRILSGTQGVSGLVDAVMKQNGWDTIPTVPADACAFDQKDSWLFYSMNKRI